MCDSTEWHQWNYFRNDRCELKSICSHLICEISRWRSVHYYRTHSNICSRNTHWKFSIFLTGRNNVGTLIQNIQFTGYCCGVYVEKRKITLLEIRQTTHNNNKKKNNRKIKLRRQILYVEIVVIIIDFRQFACCANSVCVWSGTMMNHKLNENILRFIGWHLCTSDWLPMHTPF